MAMLFRLVLTIIITYTEAEQNNNTASGVSCLECSRVHYPDDCVNEVTCQKGKVCSTEGYTAYHNHLFFDLGCRKETTCPNINYTTSTSGYKTTSGYTTSGYLATTYGSRKQHSTKGVIPIRNVTCTECCDTQNCNKYLCYVKRPKECASCKDVKQMSDCNSVDFCDQFQSCFVQERMTTLHDRRYDAGCMHKDQCKAVSGHNNQSTICCNERLCNKQYKPGISCMSCTRVANPRDCRNVVQCAPGEICTTEGYITANGHRFFSVGCKLASTCAVAGYMATKNNPNLVGRKRLNKFMHVLTECCDTDRCNNDHKPDLPRECLSCKNATTISDCTSLNSCDKDEVCYLQEWKTTLQEPRFNAGCLHRNQCRAYINNNTNHNTSVTCCDEGVCKPGISCLACSGITSPEDCSNIVHCGIGEICTAEKYITFDGRVVYDFGCKRAKQCVAASYMVRNSELRRRQNISNLPVVGRRRRNSIAHVCQECCDSEYCNRFLCHRPVSGSPLECLSCINVKNMSDCQQVKMCSTNEVCYTVGRKTSASDVTYTSGCMFDAQCDAFLNDQKTVDAVSKYTPCLTCCKEKFCNKVCDTNSTIVHGVKP